MKKSKKSIKSKIEYQPKLKSKARVKKQRVGVKDIARKIRPLSETELIRLDKALEKLKRDTYYGLGINRLPGGFIEANMVDSDRDTVDVALKYGQKDAGLDDIYDTKVTLDRKTMEVINNEKMEEGGSVYDSGKYQINDHGNKPDDFKIICKIIRMGGKDVQVCYRETNDKSKKGVEVYSGKNYIVGSNDVSYSRNYDELSEVPLKYKAVVDELKEAHKKRFECGGVMEKGGTIKKTYLPDEVEHRGKTYVKNIDLSSRITMGERPEMPKDYIIVEVLSKNLRGKTDLHHQPYKPTRWVFVPKESRAGEYTVNYWETENDYDNGNMKDWGKYSTLPHAFEQAKFLLDKKMYAVEVNDNIKAEQVWESEWGTPMPKYSIGGSMERGGKIADRQVTIEITVPKGMEYILSDDNEYELTSLIAHTLTKKWFGHGPFDVRLDKKVSDRRSSFIVTVPRGKESLISDENEYDFTRLIAHTLTKKWHGHGPFDVRFTDEFYEKGGSMETGGVIKYVDVRFEQVPVGFGFNFEGKNYRKEDAFTGSYHDGSEKKFQFSTMVNVPSTVKWLKKEFGGSMEAGGVSGNKTWIVNIGMPAETGTKLRKEEIVLGRMSDEFDVQQVIKRKGNEWLRNGMVLSIVEKKSSGGSFEKSKYKLHFKNASPIILEANSEEDADEIYRTLSEESAKQLGISPKEYMAHEGKDPSRIERLSSVGSMEEGGTTGDRERKMYLDYVNNFLTIEKFAEHYNISEEEAERIINDGRIEHEKYVANVRANSMAGGGKVNPISYKEKEKGLYEVTMSDNEVVIVDYSSPDFQKIISEMSEKEKKDYVFMQALSNYEPPDGSMATGGRIDTKFNDGDTVVDPQHPEYGNGKVSGYTEMFNEPRMTVWWEKKPAGQVVAKHLHRNTWDRLQVLDKKEKGGSIPNNYEGKQVSEVWDAWTPEQREHFLNDHVSGWIERDRREAIAQMNWKKFHDIDDDTFNSITRQLESHILFEGQYEAGGKTKKKFYLKEAIIEWQEGPVHIGVENKSYDNWKDLSDQVMAVYEETSGYNKTKIKFVWDNGAYKQLRIDVGPSDWKGGDLKKYFESNKGMNYGSTRKQEDVDKGLYSWDFKSKKEKGGIVDKERFPLGEQQRLIETFLADKSKKAQVISELKEYVDSYSKNPKDLRFGKLNKYYADEYQKAIDFIKNHQEIENQYDGKLAGDVWDAWTTAQKEHFLEDHLPEEVNIYGHHKYTSLPLSVQKVVMKHVSRGQYEAGGKTQKFKVGDYVWLSTSYGKHYGRITSDIDADPKLVVNRTAGYNVEGIGDTIEAERLHKATKEEYEKFKDSDLGATYEVELSAVGKDIKTKKATAFSLEEAAHKVRQFIEENDLGGSNWTGGKVWRNGKPFAVISYNGRIWEWNGGSVAWNSKRKEIRLEKGGKASDIEQRAIDFLKNNIDKDQDDFDNEFLKEFKSEKAFVADTGGGISVGIIPVSKKEVIGIGQDTGNVIKYKSNKAMDPADIFYDDDAIDNAVRLYDAYAHGGKIETDGSSLKEGDVYIVTVKYQKPNGTPGQEKVEVLIDNLENYLDEEDVVNEAKDRFRSKSSYEIVGADIIGADRMAYGGAIGESRAQQIIKHLLTDAKKENVSLPQLTKFANDGIQAGNLLEAYEEYRKWVNNGGNPKALRMNYEDSNRFTEYVRSNFPSKVQRGMFKQYGEKDIEKNFPNYEKGGKTSNLGPILVKLGIIEQKLNNKGVTMKDRDENGVAVNSTYKGGDIEEYNYYVGDDTKKLPNDIIKLIDEYNLEYGEYLDALKSSK